MRLIITLATLLILASTSDSLAQKQRRPHRTSSGQAAYGVATVSKSGRIGRMKKARREKAAKMKSRRAKKPGYRKVQGWAG